PYFLCTSGSESRRFSSGTYCQPSLPWGMLSSECCTQITGTSSDRAVSTNELMLAITASRWWALATTLFCTSTIKRAVLGRSCSLVICQTLPRRLAACKGDSCDVG